MKMPKKSPFWQNKAENCINKRNRLFLKSVRPTTTPTTSKKAINDEYAEVFKACDKNNRIVGYLTLYLHDCPAEFFVYPDFGYIGDLCIDQNHRHQGIAQALIARAEEYLISKNIRAIELDVFTFNTPADQLYDKIGYKNLKCRKRKLL